MAKWQPIPIGKNCYEGRSGAVSLERLINLYPEPRPEGEKGRVILYGTPGFKAWSTVGSGPIRGMHLMGQHLYVVSGDEVYHVTQNKFATLLGTISTSAGNVRMVDNGVHVGITTKTDAYAFNFSSKTLLSQSHLNGAAYQDGYGIFTQKDTQYVWITGLDDMTTINALDFTTADAFGDNVIGCISDHRELIVLKEHSIEVFYNSGAADFPFVRSQSGFLERGCISSGSIVKLQNKVFFLGDDLRVYSMQGYQPVPISTYAIEEIIREQGSQENSEAFSYSQDGHDLYVLTVNAKTIVYDNTTDKWHERSSDDEGRWRSGCYAYSWNKHLVGDYETGSIYELDLDTYTDSGQEIQRSVISPPIHAGGRRIAMHGLYADIEAGVGITSGQGSSPKLMLSFSDDGGKTWVNGVDVDMGPIGEYNYKAMWNRLGSFFQRSIKLSVSDPVKVAIIGLYADIEVLL